MHEFTACIALMEERMVQEHAAVGVWSAETRCCLQEWNCHDWKLEGESNKFRREFQYL